MALFAISAYGGLGESTAYAACANEQFRAGPSAHLPDCRAYELVSPRQLNGIPQAGMGNGAGNTRFSTPPAASDGESFMWSVVPTGIPGTESSGYVNLYAAHRTEAGWISSRQSPTAAQAEGSEPGSFSSDQRFSLFLVDTFRGGTLAPAGCGGCQLLYLRYPDGTFRPFGEGTVPTATDSDGIENGFVDDPFPFARWISPGGRHQIFESLVQLTPEAPTNNNPQVYDRTSSGLKLVSILPDNSVPAEATFAGSSVDGATVLFNAAGNLYARLDDTRTVELASGSLGEVVSGGVSADGSRAFFVQAGNISYYDFGTESSVPVTTTGNASLVQVSSDGSHAYFISESEIVAGKGVSGAPNLYVWNGNSIKFIATVEGEDLISGFPERGLEFWSPTFAARTAATNAARLLNTARSTPDGNVLAFESRAQLTAYPNEGHVEIYRYDDANESLVCVSCGSSEPVATGDSEFGTRSPGGTEGLELSEHLDVQNLSDDGKQIVFESGGALIPEDVNGVKDVYEWRDGTLSLISTGHAVQASQLFGVTPSGNDIFFETGAKLVGEGQETGALAVYDARVGGGLESQQTSQPLRCVGEACQGQPSRPPTLADLGSSTFDGKGNLKPKRCRHHRRRHHHRTPRSHGKAAKSAKRKASKHGCGAARHRRAGK